MYIVQTFLIIGARRLPHWELVSNGYQQPQTGPTRSALEAKSKRTKSNQLNQIDPMNRTNKSTVPGLSHPYTTWSPSKPPGAHQRLKSISMTGAPLSPCRKTQSWSLLSGLDSMSVFAQVPIDQSLTYYQDSCPNGENALEAFSRPSLGMSRGGK